MKRLAYFLMAVLAVIILRPINMAFAQKSQSLPQVPITYPGDTDETIKRRAQWIERAKAPMVINTKSPHPNAARLFVEWVLSPQGLVAFEKDTNYGSAFPGANTLQSRMVKVLDLAVLDEEVSNKAEELGLVQKFSAALGIKQ